MIQIILTSWKRLFRNKTNMFWVLIFPIALGTLFYAAFSNLDKAESISTIPVAVVLSDDAYGTILKQTVDMLTDGEKPFLDVTYCDENEAMVLLENKEITGILHSGASAYLQISANMTNNADLLNQSILNAFIQEYNAKVAFILHVIKEQPEKQPSVIALMTDSFSFNKEVSLQKNPDVTTYTQYFYNQLAMACLFAALGGVLVATENMADISTLAARKNVSATRKSKIIICELFAYITFEFIINMVGFLYLAYVLRVGIATRLPYAILALFLGVTTGVTLGFLIGSIGHKSSDFKVGLVFAVTMPLCFFSGLMIGSMRVIVGQIAPWLNRVNPAALISDSFYCLSIFEGHSRYYQDIFTLIILSAIFTVSGLSLTRRVKYASL